MKRMRPHGAVGRRVGASVGVGVGGLFADERALGDFIQSGSQVRDHMLGLRFFGQGDGDQAQPEALEEGIEFGLQGDTFLGRCGHQTSLKRFPGDPSDGAEEMGSFGVGRVLEGVQGGPPFDGRD